MTQSQCLQVNTRWKALAEIYTIHLSRIPRRKEMGEKKEMERHDEKGRLAMAENNYGDNNKIDAQLTPLLCTVFGIQIRKAGEKEPGQNNPRKGENKEIISSSSLPSTSSERWLRRRNHENED